MIWSREVEGGSFATPERRAALEARIGELTNAVRDEVVRRYYRQDLAERLQRAFAPEPARRLCARQLSLAPAAAESPRRFAPRSPRSARPLRPEAARRGRSDSAIARAARTRRRARNSRQARSCAASARAISRREALILPTLINHPWLLHDHLEEVAALELAHAEATSSAPPSSPPSPGPSPFSRAHRTSRENAGRPRGARINPDTSKG